MDSTTTPWAWIKAVNDIITNPPFQEPTLFPIQLKPWLYLSDVMSLSKEDRLMDLGITHVLTTNKMTYLEQLEKRLKRMGIIHCVVEGEDEIGYDMIGNHWETCKEFIHQAKHPPFGKIVVHCAAGQNRSALIVAAALLTLDEENEKPTLLQVIKYLKAKRGIVLTNLSFQKQLCIFAAEHDCLGEKPEGYTDTPLPESNFIPSSSLMKNDPFDFR